MIRDGIGGLDRTGGPSFRSVEHVAEPVFLTITNARQVVAQLPDHIAQRSYWDAGQAFFQDGAVLWRGLVSTTGTFDAIWVDRSTGKTVRRLPQRARFVWFVKQRAALTTPGLAVPGGVRRDEGRSDDVVPPQK